MDPARPAAPDLEPEAAAFLSAYFEAYFSQRDPDATLALLDPALNGFGTGVDEFSREPGQMQELYRRDLAQGTTPFTYAIDWMQGRALGPDHHLLYGVLSLEVPTAEGLITFAGLRLSVVIARQSQGWRMVHHHLSEPTGRQEEGESLPLKELRLFNARLREEVRRQTAELAQRNRDLEAALAEVRTLAGLIPICAACKKVRDDKGYWNEVEDYLHRHAGATFTHGLCPACIKRQFPELNRG